MKPSGRTLGLYVCRQEYPVWDMLERFAAMLKDEDVALDREEASELLTWLKVYQNRFDRPQVKGYFRQCFDKKGTSIFIGASGSRSAHLPRKKSLSYYEYLPER